MDNQQNFGGYPPPQGHPQGWQQQPPPQGQPQQYPPNQNYQQMPPQQQQGYQQYGQQMPPHQQQGYQQYGQQMPPQQPGAYPPQQQQGYQQYGQQMPPQQPGAYPPQQQQGYQQYGQQMPPQQQQGYQQHGQQMPPQQPGAYPPQQQQGHQQYGQQMPPQQPGAYPPQQGGYGPPQGYANAPPGQPLGQSYQQGQYGAPPPQQPYQGSYGAPPPQQHQGPPTPASRGYDLKQKPAKLGDTSKEVEAIRKAMKGFGTDDKKLIEIITSVKDPWYMMEINKNYDHRFMRKMIEDIKEETSGDFEKTLVALVRGPLAQDVHLLMESLEGAGTDEDSLNDILLGRSNADLRAIKDEFQKTFKRSLESVVRDDTSEKVQRMYSMVLKCERAEDSAPVIPQQIDQDAAELQRATEGTKMGADTMAVVHLLTSRNNGQIRAISQAYEKKYHRSLAEVLKAEFSGDMEDALLRMHNLAVDPVMADAMAIHATFEGMGTRDTLLLNRLVRLFWRKEHLEQVKRAYRLKYHSDLIPKVKEECSGAYERALVAVLIT